MKKLFIVLIIFLFSVSFVHAVTTASGSVTLANNRLSLVNGTAFVDFSAAGTLTAYLGQKLTITDSANKKAVGYIKAAGTGETLDTEILDDVTFDDGSKWEEGAGWVIAAGIATGSSANTAIYQTKAFTTGMLYKMSINLATISAGYIGLLFNDLLTVPTAESGVLSAYRISIFSGNKQVGYLGGDSFSGTIDTASLKQLLAPSATGVTITSTPNGATYNWTSIESGFNYNDASGYTYTIELVFGGGAGGFTLLNVQ